MPHSTPRAVLRAIPFVQALTPLLELLVPLGQALAAQLQAFRTTAVTPQSTSALEQAVNDNLREQGRVILQGLFNDLEGSVPEDCPHRVVWQGVAYRRRQQHPHTVATLCGAIIRARFL